MQRFFNNPRLILAIVAIITIIIVGISVFPDKFPKIPLSIPGISIPSITTPSNSKHSAVATSTRTDYSLTLADSKGLISAFDYLKVWDKTYKGKNTSPLKTALIFLTDKPQPIQKEIAVGVAEKSSFSYNLEYEKDFVIMTVFLSDPILNGTAPSKAFAAAVLFIATKMGETNQTVEQIPNSDLIGGFFKVEKLQTQIPAIPQPKP